MKKLIVLLTLNILFAQVPHKMSFQAYLSDANDMPIAPGSYEMTFRIYDALTEGNKMWEETQTVTVEGSLVSVMLGNTAPLVALSSTGYLEIQIKDDILSPRQELGASMFSLQAENSVWADTSTFTKSIPEYFGLKLDSLSGRTDSLFTLVGNDTSFVFTYDTTVVYDTTYINVDSSAYADTASYSTKADTANYAKNVHTIEFPDTIIFNSTVTYPNAWGSTDFSDWMELDLSSIIGNRRAFITLEIYGSDLSEENTVNGIFRPKSNDSNIITGELSAIHPGGANIFRMGSISGEQGTVHSIVSLVTDNNGKIEWEVATSNGITTNIWTIKLLCYQY